ncbi:rab-GTPase-TBC domain-containing protein [Sporodiniella umbellata]|nr:rab-GTPase-TBC domain-containing protein [Sporodiniella umbellata]
MVNKREEEDLVDNNPLALNETNPWQQYFADSEIRKVIRQDVERTFPDVEYFRSEKVQQDLTDILFIYCKLNCNTSYRQGMHELLAPIYWVISTDSIDRLQVDENILDLSDNIMLQSLDSTYIEHDAYILFDKLMSHGKVWYEFNDSLPSSSKAKKNVNSDSIPKLSDHLQDFGIEPQLYGLRWIRLLFGREFEIHELLTLWDAIFAEDPTLNIVEYICLVMLLHLRDELITKDYAECLSMLMRPPRVLEPVTLVKQAKSIQGKISTNSGLQILQQIDMQRGKPPRTSLYDGIPTPQVDTRRTLQHRIPHGSNSDNSFSRITNNVMKTPQFREFNRAIAGVMGSLQNVNFGDSPEASRRPVFSEFPPSIDRILPKSRNDGVSISIKSDRDTDAAKLVAMNKQMGKVVSDFVTLLEKEMFSVESEEQKVPETQMPNDENSENVSPSVETIKRSKEAPAIKDTTELLHAMIGLKHVRDVLLGKQPRFDPDVVNMPDEDWAIVDHSEVVEPQVEAKSNNHRIGFEKPLPEIRRHTSTVFESKLPQVHVPYIPDNPNPPKPAVKYRIEDLISDPVFQSNSKALANEKLKSILTEQEQNTPHEACRPSPRKRASFHTNKAVPIAGENSIDPLDAKNVDNRKAYGYDVI